MSRTNKSSLLTILALALFWCGPTEAQAQAYELRCRGGQGAFAIDRLDAKTLSLNFSSSPRAAGADGKGLDPGTCSWIDRVVNENEPRQIQFAVTGSQLQSIPNSLDNPANFRSFFVFNTNKGYFEASSHKVWNAETPSPPSSNNRPKSFKNQAGIELVWIPPANFMMGSSAEGDSSSSDKEQPVHRVTIKNGFYMGRYEVTQAQWQAVMGNTPNQLQLCGNCPVCDGCPVVGASWDDAQQFVQRLNQLDDKFTYRLPSEAEWEYSCRARTTTAFAFGNSLNAEQANFGKGKTMPVGSFQPNGFGLYDMHGNLWEWCLDWYHDNYAGAPTDGTTWLLGGQQKERVMRGGSGWNGSISLRSAARAGNSPVNHYPHVGFRVVAVAKTQ